MIRLRLSRTGASNDTACAVRSLPMVEVRGSRTVRACRPEAPPDIAIEHWDELFSAVTARLRRIVDESTQPLSEAQARLVDGPVCSSVLECADALDQLQATLRHELGRRQRLDLERFDAQTALERARVERGGARAEDRRARQPPLQRGPAAAAAACLLRQRLAVELAARAAPRDRVSLLLVDLDGVASIDQTHGREIGDELRCAVAARMSRSVRADDLVSQTAVDEFGCLVTGLPGRAALLGLACKLFDALSAPFQIGTLRLTVRPSIGMATGSAEATGAEDLFRNAGIAMERARRRDTGHAFFDGCDDTCEDDAQALSRSGF